MTASSRRSRSTGRATAAISTRTRPRGSGGRGSLGRRRLVAAAGRLARRELPAVGRPRGVGRTRVPTERVPCRAGLGGARARVRRCLYGGVRPRNARRAVCRGELRPRSCRCSRPVGVPARLGAPAGARRSRGWRRAPDRVRVGRGHSSLVADLRRAPGAFVPLGRYGTRPRPRGPARARRVRLGRASAPRGTSRTAISTNEYAARQSAGFFGIHVPHAHSAWLVVGGSRGSSSACPIVVACVYGLLLLARAPLPRGGPPLQRRSPSCSSSIDCGYFAPYGGLSPRPALLRACAAIPRARSRARRSPPGSSWFSPWPRSRSSRRRC